MSELRNRALPARFAAHVEAGGWFAGGELVVVAVSGGLDSTVLLHLLRFGLGLSPDRLLVAHFDHRMRTESADDGAWVRGLARGWRLTAEIGLAQEGMVSEDEARRARYAFLERVKAGGGARWIVTAHHADDQAETVLHRVLRGTGPSGLTGIRETREPGVLRPLLPFTRDEIARYAERHGVSFLSDPTNSDPRHTRNRIRHGVLPVIERSVAPRARRALARLARIAEEESGALDSLLDAVEEELVAAEPDGGVRIDRDRLIACHAGVQARLLRRCASRLGSSLDEVGTRLLVEFAAVAGSGRRVDAGGGLVLAREFGHLILFVDEPGVDAADGGEGALEIRSADPGGGLFRAGGRRLHVRWSASSDVAGGWVEAFALDRLGFPVKFRTWSPGDRVELSYGSKKLKKVFAEARVPVSMRSRTPVLVDGSRRVLWIPGLTRSKWATPGADDPVLTIAVQEEVG